MSKSQRRSVSPRSFSSKFSLSAMADMASVRCISAQALEGHPARDPSGIERHDLATHVVSLSPRATCPSLSRSARSHVGRARRSHSAAKDPDLEELYGKLLHETSSHEKNIARDLSRTFPKHVYFRDGGGIGQENLCACLLFSDTVTTWC